MYWQVQNFIIVKTVFFCIKRVPTIFYFTFGFCGKINRAGGEGNFRVFVSGPKRSYTTEYIGNCLYIHGISE